MSMESLNGLGYGGAHLNTRLPKILAELQGLTISGPLTGAAAGTAIAVPEGIDIQDTILKAIMFASGVPSDITSTVSIIDCRAKGTLTVGSVADGDTVVVNGKTYTFKAIDVTPSTNLAPYQVAIGNAVALTANQIAAALAVAINSGDSTLTASVASAVVTITARTEGTAGNSVALSVAGSNSHVTASGATLAGGLAGFASGTVTMAAAQVGDTVTVDGIVYTAVATGSVLGKNQFVGGTVADTDLMELGFSKAVADAIIAVSNNAAQATILALQINANDASHVFASNGLPVGAGLGYGQENEEELLMTIAQAGNALAVVTITADIDNAAAAAYTLTSSNGGRLAVSGSGTLTASSKGIKSTTNTSSNTVVLFWFKKSRTTVQW